jgi:hypothetical protein
MSIYAIRDSVNELQVQGTRVIFFDPIAPRLTVVLPDKLMRDNLHAAFRDIIDRRHAGQRGSDLPT